MPDSRFTQTKYPTARDFNQYFDPKEYLRDMFNAPDDEDRFSLSFMVRVLDSLPDNLVIHEFGGGPTMYSVAALARKAQEIHFSDVVDASLDEVRAWLDGNPNAHDWDPYLALTLETEGVPATEATVAERAMRMRESVTRLMRCDAQRNSPIELKGMHYDLVAAHHCTDVAATNVKEWQQVIKNVSTIVRPGGWLILSVTTGTRTYEVGEVTFECVNLSKQDIQEGLLVAGYRRDSIIVESYEIEHSREYSGITSAFARKR